MSATLAAATLEPLTGHTTVDVKILHDPKYLIP